MMMKNPILFSVIIILALSFTLITNETSDYVVESDFSLKIKGTSNVHDWESSVKEISGNAKVIFSESGEIEIEKCKINIPVKSIKSTKGSIMDKKTWKALKYKTHPNIKYSLANFKRVRFEKSGFTTSTIGKLTIAGKSKWIDMDVKGKILEDNSIEISGARALKMTDFNIDPPSALMGAMTTGDDITIEFRIKLKNN